MTQDELFELELETKEGECFTLGHAIGRHCIKQLYITLQEVENE